MSGGIHAENCHVILNECEFIGPDIAVSLVNSALTVKSTLFDSVATAVKGIGNTPIDAQGVVHTESKGYANGIPLEVLRRFANANV